MGRGGRVIYRRANGNRQRRARRKGDDGDEDDGDEEYVLGEDDEEESESSNESLASSSSSEEEDFDFGSVDSEEEELELEEEEDGEIPRSKYQRKPSNGRRRVKKARDFIDDEEEEEKTVRKKGRVQSYRRKSRVSESSDEWEEEEEEEEDDDEDFSLDEDDEDEEEVSLNSACKVSSRRKGDPKKHGKKHKSRVSRRKKEKRKTVKDPSRKRKRGKRGTLNEDEDEDDHDFIVKDRVKVSKKKRGRTKVGRRNNTRLMEPKKRQRHSVESDTSEFEFLTSDEDDFVTEERIKSKRGRKAKPAANGVRKRRQRSGSESSDSDYVISEEELKDLGLGGVLDQPQPKKIIDGSKVEEKGKEKQADDLGKQVCGICLSEEQRGTIQGVLNCCAHYFCFACIMEWSKVESRCPVCKRRFETIAKSSRSDPGFGLRNAVIRVQKRDQVYQPSEEEMRGMLDPYENVVCIECQQGGDDSLMLLCDICDSPAHTYCVGLGREVPEGNWYCECCQSAGERSSHPPVQDRVTPQGPRNNRIFGSFETDVPANGQAASNSRRSILNTGQSSSQRIDLNLPPRDFQEEDQGAASQMSGGGASTLSGRRAIQQHIRILLSNNRARQIFPRATVPCHDNDSNSFPLEIQRNQETLHDGEGLNSLHRVAGIGQSQQNSRPFIQSQTRPFIQSQATLAPCMYREQNSYRIVEGAKEKVQSMVKSHLKHLSRASLLERADFKDIARRATHTILAACGVKHHRSMVAAPIQPPNNCSHELDGNEPAYLVTDCCSSCFRLFVEGVIQKIINASS
ncbi:uncharacterized protein [Typha latifolia]|uniref:uncharacterized protein n=1 Tax=Typha latifolia TaxID=4733 RepID=UPI003C2F2B86